MALASIPHEPLQAAVRDAEFLPRWLMRDLSCVLSILASVIGALDLLERFQVSLGPIQIPAKVGRWRHPRSRPMDPVGRSARLRIARSAFREKRFYETGVQASFGRIPRKACKGASELRRDQSVYHTITGIIGAIYSDLQSSGHAFSPPLVPSFGFRTHLLSLLLWNEHGAIQSLRVYECRRSVPQLYSCTIFPVP